MILTDDERLACWSKHTAANDYDKYSLKEHVIRALREHEAAILAKIGEPVAWRYQNANTDTEYLCWWKQTGGRNWTPLYKLPEVTK